MQTHRTVSGKLNWDLSPTAWPFLFPSCAAQKCCLDQSSENESSNFFLRCYGASLWSTYTLVFQECTRGLLILWRIFLTVPQPLALVGINSFLFSTTPFWTSVITAKSLNSQVRSAWVTSLPFVSVSSLIKWVQYLFLASSFKDYFKNQMS